MSKPLLYDLYCGVGGAAMGYARAGYEVVGVDKHRQPRYPFPYVRADVMQWLPQQIERGGLEQIALFHASPPCQAYSAISQGTNWGYGYPDFVARTRVLLEATGRPYVIENVMGAPLRRDVMLCGEMFGLEVIRHRIFELSRCAIAQPEHRQHRGRVAGMRHGIWYDGPYFPIYGHGTGKGSLSEWKRAMGIDWTNVRCEITEAIPPAYTQWLGSQLLAA